jgi:hypothetical protein
MSTTIKYSAGDEVFWLSHKGFRKGVVKTVRFIDDNLRIELTYFLCTSQDADIYRGEDVKESKIFDTWEEMISHYAAQAEETE